MAGVFLILLGLFRLGTIIKFIPYPIVVGFTSGIAVTIFTTQIKDLFGLTTPEMPEFRDDRPLGNGRRRYQRRHHRPHAPLLEKDTRFADRYRRYDAGRLSAETLRRNRLRRNYRRPIHDQLPTARRGHPRPLMGRDERTAARSHHHRRTGRHRIAAVGNGRRRRDGGQAQLQPGAHGPRHRQRGDASVRRHSRHRSHRPHDDQYQQRRSQASSMPSYCC